ncbi:methyltransferase domain-containing protein [Desulforhopalus vacuolatus]|uniref:class I SAM-dependent methyltransferase n=1 Tax=Desulforhopalus vacuolatus TaxID=40414 RepID=UPI00196590C2|nr:methyltransferase domain-containing protein [Desulforhopalus vacuolatus]MBM9519340.1 methyltransferase domain-containing protein [Desulforhopalus vacuolatus]
MPVTANMPANIQTAADIDWTELRRRAMAAKSRRAKSAADWDSRADSFASRVKDNSYVDLVIDNLPLTPQTTLLDIGSGPGTLALPIARCAAAVTALDFSGRMLELLEEKAAEQGIRNITTKKLDWQDDWQAAGILPHHITLASRSTAVTDLPAALNRLNAFATEAVFLSDSVSPTPFEPGAYEAVGIEFRPGPDYIYTLNILHSMGIAPDVKILEFDRVKHYVNLEEALTSFLWMFNTLDAEQTTRLSEYVRSISVIEPDGSLTLTRRTPPRWALISWQKTESTKK